jgi:hypothetical protein
MSEQTEGATTTDPDPRPAPPAGGGWSPPAYPGLSGPAPQYGYRWGSAPVIQHTDGFATASLVMSLVSLFMCLLLIFPILGVVFGHVSLSRIKRSGGARRGRGMAIAGLVIGYITLLAGIGLWIAIGTSDTTDTTPRPDAPSSIAEFGTDPTLDALARQCARQDFAACDELWLISEPGSGYEAYGHSCGGRQGFSPSESPTYHERCTDLYD